MAEYNGPTQMSEDDMAPRGGPGGIAGGAGSETASETTHGAAHGLAFVDTYMLTRLSHEVSASVGISQFERLLSDLPEQAESEVHWSVRGELDAHGQRFLHIAVKANPQLICQRCLKPFIFEVDVGNRLQLVASESDLDPEGGLDDDSPERILGSQRFDVLGLVEDEIILALPYVPKHDVCPSLPTALDADDSDTGRPSPFAVLSQLKKN